MNYVTSLDRAYSILNATRIDTLDDIKKKYRQMLKQYHPDVCSHLSEEEATQKAKEINWAFEKVRDSLLSDTIVVTGGNESYYNTSTSYTYYNATYTEKEAKKKHTDSSAKKRAQRENKNAYWKVGNNFYCWDPDEEFFNEFAYRCENACKEILQEEIKNILSTYNLVDSEASYNLQGILTTLLKFSFRDKIFGLIQAEYIKPYYSFVRYMNEYRIEDEYYNGEKIRKYVFDNYLRETAGENTIHIERCKAGQTLQLCLLKDHPVYPYSIEIQTLDGYSLGLMNPPFATFMYLLIENGALDVSASVKEIITRAEKGPRARQADIIVEFNVSLLKEIKNEEFISKRKEIETEVNKLRRIISNVIRTYIDFNTENVEEYIDNIFTDQKLSNKGVRVLNSSITHGCCYDGTYTGFIHIDLNDLLELPNSILTKLIVVLTLITGDRKKLQNLIANKKKKMHLYDGDFAFEMLLKSGKLSDKTTPYEEIKFCIYRHSIDGEKILNEEKAIEKINDLKNYKATIHKRKEEELLSHPHRFSNSVQEKHMWLSLMFSFYYTYKEDNEYWDKTVLLGEENISLCANFIKEANKKKLSYKHHDIGSYPYIWNKLSYMYEKKKDYKNVIRICNQGLMYTEKDDYIRPTLEKRKNKAEYNLQRKSTY